MINSIVLRKMAVLLKENNNFRLNRYSNFDIQKEKEIIVWVRLQKGLAKDQVVDFIVSKFNTSEPDAVRLYYRAYPEGVDQEELNLLKEIDFECARMTNSESSTVIDDCCQVLIGNRSVESVPGYQINLPTVLDNLSILLKNRQII